SSLGADLTVVGGSGHETLNINDRAAGHAYTVTTDTIARDGAGAIHFEHIDRVNLMGGSGADTFDVRATAEGTETTIDAGPGDDTFKFSAGGGVSGTINGGTGVDKLDYTGRGSAVTVNFQTSTAPGIAGGFVGI